AFRTHGERVEELVVDAHPRALEVGAPAAVVAEGEGRDGGLLPEVLVEAEERPVAARLRLPEPEPARPGVGVVGGRVPVVEVVPPPAERLRPDEVRDGGAERQARLVEAAPVAGDGVEGGGLLSSLWRLLV